MAFRVDIGQLRPPRRMPDGRLVADAVFSRSGVFEYTMPNGKVRREYRPPDEVFKKDALESFHLAPVTDGHPPQMLDATNARQYSVGSVGQDLRRDGEDVVGTIAVFDAETIRKMDDGKRDVSLGYEVDLDETPGITPDGQKYDAIQRNIRGNHAAIVSIGRAGNARVRMDAAAVQVDEARKVASQNPPCYNEVTMPDKKNDLTLALERLTAAENRADGAETQLAEQTARADSAEARVSELEGQLEGLRDRHDALKNRLDAQDDPEELKAALQAMEVKVQEAKARADEAENPERLRKAIRERVALERAGESVLGKEESAKFDSMSDRELMEQCILKITGKAVDGSRSDEFVRGRFDAAVEGYGNTAEALADIRRAAAENAAREREDAAMTPRQKMIEANRAAGHKPLSN